MEELIKLKAENDKLQHNLSETRKMLHYLQQTAESAVRINQMLFEIHQPGTKHRCTMKVLK